MVNNLSSKEIVLFYEYVYYYENHIKNFHKNASLGDLPNQFLTLLKSQSILIQNSKSVLDPARISGKGKVVYIKGKESVLLCFAKHLRNSIAHCLVERKENSFYLKDYRNNSKSYLTMIGVIQKENLIKIIQLFIDHFILLMR